MTQPIPYSSFHYPPNCVHCPPCPHPLTTCHPCYQRGNDKHHSHNSAQLQSAPASHLLVSVSQRGVWLFLLSSMWEMYIFVSANTKQRRMLGQHQTEGSERGGRSERERCCLLPSLYLFLCFSGRTHHHSTAWLWGASVYKSSLNSPDSGISSLYQEYQSTSSMKGFLLI